MKKMLESVDMFYPVQSTITITEEINTTEKNQMSLLALLGKGHETEDKNV